MINVLKGLLNFLCVLPAAVFHFFGGLGGLAASVVGMIPVSLPVSLIQLALCRFCDSLFLRMIPAALGGLLFLGGLWGMGTKRGWETLSGLLLMIPAMLLLVGSGFGWLLWSLARPGR